MIFIAVYGTLLLEERLQWYIIYDIVVLNCLFMVDWFSCWFPGSWRRALNIKQTHRSNIFIKKTTTTTIIGLTWRLFFVCSSCLFTFSLWRGHAYQAVLSLAMHGSNRFALKLHRSPLFACFVEEKSTENRFSYIIPQELFWEFWTRKRIVENLKNIRKKIDKY